MPLWTLIERTQAGDHEAYGELYLRTVGEVRQFLHERTRDSHLVDDLVQSTYERLLRAIGRVVRGAGSPVALLITIARNLLISHFRRAEQRLTVTMADIPEPAASGEDDPAHAAVADALWRFEARRLLWSGGEGMPPDQVDVLRLRYRDDLPVRDTAARLHRDPATIRQTQVRATRRLRADRTVQAFAKAWS